MDLVSLLKSPASIYTGTSIQIVQVWMSLLPSECCRSVFHTSSMHSSVKDQGIDKAAGINVDGRWDPWEIGLRVYWDFKEGMN